MATTRFTKFTPRDYSFKKYVPKPFIPNFAAWDELLASQQTEFDKLQALSEVVPKHRQADRPLVQEYMSGIRQQIEDISSVYAGEGLSAGHKARNALKRQIRRDWQPGGKATAFQERLAQEDAEKKRLREFFKDNPRLADYSISKIEAEPFEKSPGVYGRVLPVSDIYKDISDKEMSEWINRNLDNIKDTLLSQGYDKAKLDRVSTLHEFKEVMGRDYNDVLVTLANLFPEEYKQSLRQRYAAERYYDPSLEEMDPAQVFQLTDGRVTMDKQGNLVTADTPAGRLLSGASYARARQELDVQRIKDQDEWLLEGYKSRLRKKELEYEWTMGDQLLRTKVYTDDTGMPNIKDLDLKIDSKGQVSRGSNVKSVGQGLRGASFQITGGKEQLGGFKDYALTNEFKKKYPELHSEYVKWSDYIQDMSDAEAWRLIETKYNEKKEQLTSKDAFIKPYTKETKEAKSIKATLIGDTEGTDGVRLGTIASTNQVLIPTMPGVPSEPMEFKDAAEKYFGFIDKSWRGKLKNKNENIRRFVQNTDVIGEVQSPNSEVPSGHQIAYTSPTGEIYTFIVSPRSLQEEAFNSPLYELGKAQNDGTIDETRSVNTRIPAIGEVKALGEDYYLADELLEHAQSLWLDKKYDDYKDVMEDYDEAINNPYKNIYRGRRSEIVNKNGDPLYMHADGSVDSDPSNGVRVTLNDIAKALNRVWNESQSNK